MTTIKLYGAMAAAVGRAEWRLAITTPREAIKAIDVNSNGKLGAFLRANEQAKFTVIVDGAKIVPAKPAKEGDLVVPDEFFLQGAFALIEIMPAVEGADSVGIIEAILGVILIIVGIIFIETPAGVPLIIMGAGMLVGAALSLLSPAPKLGAAGNINRSFSHPSTTLGQGDEADPRNNTSYLFSGASNTTTEGGAVPLIYGIMIVGSRLVSMALLPSSINEQITGEARPPQPDDAFFDLPVWARLPATTYALLLKTPRWVRQFTLQARQSAWETLGLPVNYPAGSPTYGRRTPPPYKAVSPQAKLHFLINFCNFFTGAYRGLTKREMLELYWLLDLGTIDNPQRASWKDLAFAIAIFYSPDP